MDPLPCLRDVELIHLSKDIPHTSYSELCDAMGYPYSWNQSILANHRGNYNEAMTEILINWNTDQAETSQSRSNLTRKLYDVKLGGLGKKLFKGEYLPKKQYPHEQEATPLQSSSAAAALLRRPPPAGTPLLPLLPPPPLLNEVLERRYTDPARLEIVQQNQGFTPKLKRQDSSSAPFNVMENSRHDIFKSPTRRLTVSGSSSNTAELTSLCRSLSYDWATHNGASALSSKQHLFELSADDIEPNQTIENAIKDQLFPDHDEIDEALIRQLLKDMPDGITILLDGCNGKNCGDNIMDVLLGRTLQEVTVMVTTQPRFADMLHRRAPGRYDRIDML